MAAMLMGAWSLQSCDNGPTKEVWLDEFGQDSCYVQDWGMLEVNRSVVHTPLTVNGVVYERGLGAHSISRLLYDLDGKAVSISGLAGLMTRTCLQANFSSRFSVTRRNSGRVE